MESKARTRLISLGVLLLVLITGFVLGLAWERRPHGVLAGEAASEARDRDHDRRGREGRDDDGDDDRRRGRRLIIDRVELTPAQEERVDSIVDIHRERLEELQRELRAEYGLRQREIVEGTREAIRSVLTLKQRTRYDSLLVRFDRKRKRDDRNDRRDRDDEEERDGP